MEMSRHDFIDPLFLFFEPSIRLKFLNQLGSSFLIILYSGIRQGWKQSVRFSLRVFKPNRTDNKIGSVSGLSRLLVELSN